MSPEEPFAPGREGLKQAFKLFWEATPGYHRIEDQIAYRLAKGHFVHARPIHITADGNEAHPGGAVDPLVAVPFAAGEHDARRPRQPFLKAPSFPCNSR